jgi:hypothetical protein
VTREMFSSLDKSHAAFSAWTCNTKFNRQVIVSVLF